ncbi:ABC transporter ATP-binding protein [Phyllobacterium sp. SB3]|uniref:ABC transporter ATP-binding protein n=1 Tax=Phyllobacterium sp. SB3 TaxID=3156073 RepID=UPI0032AF988E
MNSVASMASSSPSARPAALTLSHISKSFFSRGQTLEIMRDVSLTVEAGEFLAIVGPSGCGKSTLLRMIQGLEPPSSGEVRFSAGDEHAAKRGFVFQRDGLYPWRTVQRNVMFGLELANVPKIEARERALAMIELVGLKGFEEHYPNELSGGMRQRVNLARALAIDPTMLLMDEPFAALDALTREHMQQELIRIADAAAKTVILITHQIDEAVLLADRVAVLGARPSYVLDVITIDLPKPRSLALKRNPAFQAYVDQIWEMVTRVESPIERKNFETNDRLA